MLKYAAARSDCAEGRLGRKGRAHRFICPGLEVGGLGGQGVPHGKALLDNRQEASSEMAVEEKPEVETRAGKQVGRYRGEGEKLGFGLSGPGAGSPRGDTFRHACPRSG